METNDSLQLKNMTMSKIIVLVEDPSQADPAYHPKGWCGMTQDSESILWWVLISIFISFLLNFFK
jgi:hypothetical protein